MNNFNLDSFNLVFSAEELTIQYEAWCAEGLEGEYIESMIFDRGLCVFQDNDKEFYYQFHITFLRRRKEYLQLLNSKY
jgi:hypothetical protein